MNSDLRKKLESRRGIRLDIGCGGQTQKGWVGLDMRKLPGVDIVHNLLKIPYPLPKDCCHTILASHVLEHIPPHPMPHLKWKPGFLAVMDELWRIMQVDGQLLIAIPYGKSDGYVQDPTHCNPCNEATWQYFDPDYPLYQIYQPKPWKVERNSWHTTGNMEIVLAKRKTKKA